MTAQERERLLLELEPLIKKSTRRLARTLPSHVSAMSYFDMEQAAWVGAIKAVDNYDPRRGTLMAYVNLRIYGEILDYLRSTDFVTREGRTRMKAGLEPAPHMTALETTDDGEIRVEDPRAQRQFEIAEAAQDVSALLSRIMLEPRERDIVDGYLAGSFQVEIGYRHHIGPARVSQLYRQAIRKIKAMSKSYVC